MIKIATTYTKQYQVKEFTKIRAELKAQLKPIHGALTQSPIT